MPLKETGILSQSYGIRNEAAGIDLPDNELPGRVIGRYRSLAAGRTTY